MAAVAVAAMLLLSGCSGATVGGAVNGAVKEATGGDVSLAGELPAGWPKEIPVIDGNLGFGAANTTNGDTGWVVTVATSAADPLADAKKKLEDAGFSSDTSATANVGEAGVAALTNGTWSVVLAGTPEGVLYTVNPAA
ncbi:hypothetical protein E3T26_02975 [Cryobacterium sp. TMT1-21]|uniref:PASTA domain-containing protein n=1 Tax=Cryobacterium shii TaxID=1259235 RepID=A0AAQ2HG62_9MICO|nr:MULTISPECIES: hypothetical protein [Cryobacterium]TFC51238.1 hypothetical protein E3O49_03955 [Cryobacterium shii]TFD17065.1 hypothetical protein E3T26_02975 [Cryobacterium sp. TMT1-21]TFD18191.1 hypothetical protein E3T32_12700 [Cryobacterium sp. TMT2-23]TFD41434.1 hypothetical protein E3T37_04165 [Cryobacterium sp. TMT2-10]